MKLKLIQPELTFEAPDQPRQIVTESSAAFFDLCDRADRGELVIESVARGDGNGQWKVNVRYER
jgi:hypothetical protein